MEEFWSILIIKQYFAECVFVLALGWFRSVMDI